MAHCRREVMHAQWEILLDDEFLEAYKHGIVIECCDGIKRWFYPRILTYSADYPEKYVTSRSLPRKACPDSMSDRVLLAGIRDKGHCLCPRCLIPRARVQNMGMRLDITQRQTLARIDNEDRRWRIATARKIIYDKNYAIDTDNVETLLQPHSLVPAKVSAHISICYRSRG